MPNGGTWVPKAQRTCTWRLFHQIYMCRHSVFHARTVEDVDFFGTPASGDAEFDKTMLNEKRLFYKTPVQMIELFRRDVPVGLFKIEDAKQIYQDISDHLRNCSDAFRLSPNIKPDNDMIDELMAMDRFANVIYPHAVPFFKEGFQESTLMRRMMETGSMSLPVTEAPAPKEKKNDEPYEAPQRESLADIFANRREIASKTWRG